MNLIIQNANNEHSSAVANEVIRLSNSGDFKRLRAAVAYVTRSGLRTIQEAIPQGAGRVAEWLVSIDFGRTEPEALRHLLTIGEVRVHDGENVILRPLLKPHVVYHPKSYVFDHPPKARPVGICCGSANTTSSGMTIGIEHVTSCITSSTHEPVEWLTRFNGWWKEAWDIATVVSDDFIDRYEQARMPLLPTVLLPFDTDSERTVGSCLAENKTCTEDFRRLDRWAAATYFFMDAGAAGANLTDGGNQLDAPRGTRVYFGFSATEVPRNKILGSITVRYLNRHQQVRTVKFANNQMDKINLPTPGDPFPNSYVDKCICFRREPNHVYEMMIGNRKQRNEWIDKARAAGTLSKTQANKPRVYGFFD